MPCIEGELKFPLISKNKATHGQKYNQMIPGNMIDGVPIPINSLMLVLILVWKEGTFSYTMVPMRYIWGFYFEVHRSDGNHPPW